jgi:hypothetical protein
MNKIILRSILILIGVVLLLLLLLKGRSPFGKSNSLFASEPQNEITKVEFTQEGRKLSLEKTEAGWLINGRTETRKSSILFILRVLKEIKIKSPVSEELFESEISMKKISPARVRVFEKRKLLRTFFVYKTQSNIYGNIMKLKGSSKPYIVYIPGFEGEIGSAFTLNELFWQPYTVFNQMPSEIASVKFENFSDTSSSFSISRNNQHYIVSDQTGVLNGADSSRVSRYISYFTWIPFESWALDINETVKKSLESQKPIYRVTLITTTGKKTMLTLWERVSDENGKKTRDSDRLYGKTENSKEFFIIRYFDIDPLIKKRSYFFTE